jgi:hypothetical protein
VAYCQKLSDQLKVAIKQAVSNLPSAKE